METPPAVRVGTELPSGPDGRIVTLPNLLSALRLASVPLFLWLLLGPRSDLGPFAVLAASSLTDFLDGWVARRFDQTSRLGAMLDPVVDRVYVAAAVVGLAVRGIVPYWLLGVLAGRDALLAGQLPILRRHGYGPPQVHLVGKAATMCLLYGLPLLLVAALGGTVHAVFAPIAWAFTIWGTTLYLVAAWLYSRQAYQLSRPDAAVRLAAGSRAGT
jgi:cardiolipin synthase